ncbi:methyl-accepting chemotaxis protein [Novosphingobium clariflavum]|uniref:Methyl-accepting chemotaxis protein n=1 Tax=Novosphingobium clariflavum TaxID=2029884 RepID=A0ABV6S5V9_9SPHN|nr:methyl-accepting chemotaxis protein [Novosphingobium clariflavum]
MIRDQSVRIGRLLVGLVALAIVIAGFTTYKIRFGGPIQAKHALQDEMLADILPPPAYVVEPYLDATLAVNEPTEAARRLDDMARLQTEFRQRQAYWRDAPLPGEVAPQMTRVIATAATFWEAVDRQFVPAVRARDEEAMQRVHRSVLTPLYHRQHEDVVKLVETSRAYSARELQRDMLLTSASLTLSALIAIGVAVAIGWTAAQAQSRVVRPLEDARLAFGELAAGRLETAIPGLDRTDELGAMARAMDVFRRSGLDNREAESAQHDLVEALSSGLRKLADKDLEAKIHDRFPADYEQVRRNFNAAVEALAAAMTTVGTGSGNLSRTIGEIRMATDDLSARNQQQAANLEETAASMQLVSNRVRESAATATRARSAVTLAHAETGESAEVVQQAVTAMAAIESSAQEIGTIVDVIDAIAFQTNLLALNAGVEAARAGDAGKGFAVVAAEVRALAQRSADAAQNIKLLIARSAEQVGEGVALVSESGSRLGEIAARIAELNDMIAAMAQSAMDQSTELDQVSTAISELDRVTQRNAAMVEQTTAATRELESEAHTLTALMAQFRTQRGIGHAGSLPAPDSRTEVRRLQPAA